MLSRMDTDFRNKSTLEEIRERFDNDVDRFADLETGQQSTIDAPLSLDLITDAARRVNPDAQHLLDIGCGAGNYTLKMLAKLPGLNCTLVDLSRPMLDRASQRVQGATAGEVTAVQGDIRHIALPVGHYDIVLAGAVLHHLRGDADWEFVFGRIYGSLKPGGSFWISDLVTHNSTQIDALFQDRYGDYLARIGGADYRNKVLAYIQKEDSPRSVTYQLDLLKKTGFREVDILHKNSCFAAFGGVK
ncbi:class I SAM-dependent methyltransferase [Pontibacter saemangeumensis]|uniref:Class I SAM-dependent methyltransferase n=1 Tax=Pontibacter saemangeumensis TaxID=1084525 RepID=A0ABP8M0F1_9BACT